MGVDYDFKYSVGDRIRHINNRNDILDVISLVDTQWMCDYVVVDGSGEEFEYNADYIEAYFTIDLKYHRNKKLDSLLNTLKPK